MYKILALFAVLLAGTLSAKTESPFADAPDRVYSLPGLGNVQGIQMAGHLPVSEGKDAYEAESNLFYWFVGSEESVEKKPLILWLNGGPGASGLYGFFAENGPYTIQNDGTLAPRTFAWSKKANYLIIEQAPGVGFSYAAPKAHLTDEAQVVNMFHMALKEFYKKYPKLKSNALFIAGESYAGKFIPLLATHIVEEKSAPLQGILIGDGWVDPIIQLSSNAEFAYSHGLIDLETSRLVEEQYQICAKEIEKQTPSSRKANELCDGIQKIIQSKSGVSATNIRMLPGHDYSSIAHYINQKKVREALHVDPRVKEATLISRTVFKDLEIGLQDSAAFLYPPLLARGIRVLIYNGLDDGRDCNFIGTDRWLAELEWPGQENLKRAATSIWKSKTGDVAGYIRKANGLTQVKIRGAGHMAPQDQPENVREMVYRFIFIE